MRAVEDVGCEADVTGFRDEIDNAPDLFVDAENFLDDQGPPGLLPSPSRERRR